MALNKDYGKAKTNVEVACGTTPWDVPLTFDLLQRGEASYRAATCIPAGAFTQQKSNVFFASLPELQSIDSKAFVNWEGTLNFTGSFPKLRSIGDEAFGLSRDSNFDMTNLSRLTVIGKSAFEGVGAINLVGSGEVSDE